MENTTKQKLKKLNLDFENYTIPELCKMVEKSNESVRRVLKDWGVKTKNILHSENNNSETYTEKLKNIKFDSLSVREISEMLNIPTSAIYDYLNSNNIKKKKVFNNRKAYSLPPINIPEEFLQIIIGSMLGDGHISNPFRGDLEGSKNQNSRLSITHCEKQKEYLLYKKELIDKYVKTHYSVSEVFDVRFKNPLYLSHILQTSQNIAFNKFKKDWYSKGKGNKDTIPSYVKTISPLALAILFMDDGSKEPCGYVINCQTFKETDLYFLKGVLSCNYDLEVTIRKNSTIYIHESDIVIFNEIVLPHMHPTMLYKLHSPNKIPLNGETPERTIPC